MSGAEFGAVQFGAWVGDATSGTAAPSDWAVAAGRAFGGAIPPPGAVGFRDAALFWSAYVGPVFPLNAPRAVVPDDGAKKPHPAMFCGAGTKMDRGSSDAAQIAEWWSSSPLSNIGFSPARAGVLIVDIDPRHNGAETWRKIKAEYGVDDRDCGRVQSPRGDGGVHLWFRLPDGVQSYVNGQLGPGVDRPWQTPVPPSMRYVRAVTARSGGGVGGVVGPAAAAFQPYRWIAGDPRALPVAPDVLIGASNVVRPTHFRDAQWLEGKVSEEFNAEGDLILTKAVLHNLWNCGMTLDVQQNRLLKRIACRWVRRGYTHTQIVGMLWAIAERSEQHENDPWSLRDMEKIARSARSFIEYADERENAATATGSGTAADYAAWAANLAATPVQPVRPMHGNGQNDQNGGTAS